MNTPLGWDDKQRLVREWDKSGLTAPAFGKLRGIRPETLRAWGRALRGPLEPRSRRRDVPRDLEFIEVAEAGPAERIAEARVEISVGTRRLTCFSTWSPAELAALVRALEDDA